MRPHSDDESVGISLVEQTMFGSVSMQATTRTRSENSFRKRVWGWVGVDMSPSKPGSGTAAARAPAVIAPCR